jgi:hypothetical protein
MVFHLLLVLTLWADWGATSACQFRWTKLCIAWWRLGSVTTAEQIIFKVRDECTGELFTDADGRTGTDATLLFGRMPFRFRIVIGRGI